MSADDIRARVRGTIPDTKDQMAIHLNNFVKELKALGLSSNVKDQRGLIPVLAANIAANEGGDAASKMAAAEQQIIGNNTTALTLSDDRYVGLEGGSLFDEFHELIHICSAKGGVSPLHEWKLQMNEGAINVFSELAAPKAGIKIDDRYTDETRIVKKLLKLIKEHGDENEGYKALYGMTFCGDRAEHHRTRFFGLVGAAYNAMPAKSVPGKGENATPTLVKMRPDGKTPKPMTEKNWTDNEAGDEFASKVKNWSVKWLEDRLPTLP